MMKSKISNSNATKASNQPFFTPYIQPKLAIGQKGDRYEQEADQMAERVINKMEEEEVMMKAESSQHSPSSGFEQQLQQSRGGGQALPSATLREMNQAFGADFSSVRVHSDHNAVQMNEDIGAKAFTNRNNIYFNEGKYQPASSDGKRLLAHELTHTIQQGAVGERIQKEDKDPKEQKKEEKNQGSEALTKGIGLVGKNLMSNNPQFRLFLDPRLRALQRFAWTSRPTSYKATMIGFGLTNLAILGGAFATDPGFRNNMIQLLEGQNLAAPLQLIPGHQYIPLTGFSYKLPSDDKPSYQFSTKFSVTPYFDLIRRHHARFPQMSLDMTLKSAYDPAKGSFGVKGGKVSLGLLGGGIKLSGETFTEKSPYPYMMPGTMPGQLPTTVMQSYPALPSQKFDTMQYQFMLSIDFMKLLKKKKKK
ncbi:MAG: DUF4157 domain-containing protein [Bacteroidota bacterium]